jgi:hypothetical protein
MTKKRNKLVSHPTVSDRMSSKSLVSFLSRERHHSILLTIFEGVSGFQESVTSFISIFFLPKDESLDT